MESYSHLLERNKVLITLNQEVAINIHFDELQYTNNSLEQANKDIFEQCEF